MESEKGKNADELFKEFREVSVTEFFRKNKAHLGYSGTIRSLTTVIHETVTNSLDACEEAKLLPNITVEINALGKGHYRFIERDNGPGIPSKHVASVFGKMLAGTKFHRNIQLRGQQGIGVSGVTMFSQMTTGKPIKITTSTRDGKVHEIKLMIDVSKNTADVIGSRSYSEYWRGTEIEGEVKRVMYNISDKGVYEYLRRTAITNPHAQITFIDPEGRKTVFERSSKQIPKPPKEMKPHPKGLDVDDLVQFSKKTKATKVSSFLTSALSRMSNQKVKELQERISFDLKKNPHKLTWAECEEIIDAIKEIKFLAPPTEGLRPIGERQIKNAVLNILNPEFESVLTRSPKTHSGGVPFQVEVAIAYGGNAGRNTKEGVRSEVMRFANRAPLLFDAGGCAITQAVNSVDWKRYEIRDFDNSAITIFVNLVSTHVPYTSAGKQNISNEKEIVKEIKIGLMEVGRGFQRYYSKKRRELEKESRRKILLKYSTEVAAALSKLTERDEDKIYENLVELIEEKLKIDDGLIEETENNEVEEMDENEADENEATKEFE